MSNSRGQSTRTLSRDDGTAGLVKDRGVIFVQRFFGASKTLQVHERGNRASARALSDLLDAIGSLHEVEECLSLRVTRDFLNINEVRLPMPSQSIGPFEYLTEALVSRDIEGIDIHAGVDIEMLGRFMDIFFKEYDRATAFNAITEAMSSEAIDKIGVVQWVEREMQLRDNESKRKKGVEQDIKSESNRVFFRTAALVGEMLKGIERRRAIQLRKAERLTQQMVDIIQTDDSILIGLSSIKTFDEYTFAHSVNVSILSMLIGDRVGLPKPDVARLGLCGLLHDIGKTYVPQSILNNPGKLDEQDWELMKYHTLFGVVELSRIKALREIGDAFFVALQHHVHFNMNGYPLREGGWQLRLFSRITTIADYFDAMTTPRIYQEPLTPDRALRFIVENSGEIFDPFLTKVFIRAMGIYPIGTVVRLSSGEEGVVVRQNDEGLIHRPIVLVPEEGKPVEEAEQLDLSERRADGTFYRKIVEAFYERDSELLKTRFFVAE
jgi:HD-GYP domain-containing protein (c-di-GMP phosphodiesterase class II)